MSSLRFLLPWSLACSPTVRDSGTIIGNPEAEPSALRVAYGTDVRTRSASVFLQAVEWADCDSQKTVVPVGETVDLLGAPSFETLPGVWCGVVLVFEGPLVLEGVHARGIDVTLEVEAEDTVLRARGGYTVGTEPLVLELAEPDWFSLDDLEVGDDGRFLDPSSPAHDELARRVRERSSAYEDRDGDGEVNDQERAQGQVAQGRGGEDDTGGGG